jgi:hypothetical protein
MRISTASKTKQIKYWVNHREKGIIHTYQYVIIIFNTMSLLE